MHFNSLLHVRDHVKVQGRAYDLLMYIALHTNMHTGEAFELTIERQAQRHQLTPTWTRILLNGVIATGELVVERSRGRHPNRYRFPLERCHACQGDDLNPKVELRVEDGNPKVIPAQPPSEPPSGTPATLNSDAANPQVEGASTPQLARIEREKEVKEVKDSTEGPTPNKDAGTLPKAEQHSPFWCQACGVSIPTCRHRVIYRPPPERSRRWP